MGLLEQRCRPCEGTEDPLDDDRVDTLLDEVPGWDRNEDSIEREFTFTDFKRALAFVNDVGDVAEQEGHHPDILLHGYKHVRLTLTTHAIGGLSENDFILAAKVDRLAD